MEEENVTDQPIPTSSVSVLDSLKSQALNLILTKPGITPEKLAEELDLKPENPTFKQVMNGLVMGRYGKISRVEKDGVVHLYPKEEKPKSPPATQTEILLTVPDSDLQVEGWDALCRANDGFKGFRVEIAAEPIVFEKCFDLKVRVGDQVISLPIYEDIKTILAKHAPKARPGEKPASRYNSPLTLLFYVPEEVAKQHFKLPENPKKGSFNDIPCVRIALHIKGGKSAFVKPLSQYEEYEF